MDARASPAAPPERPIAGLAANGAGFVVLSGSDAMTKVAVAALPGAQIMALRGAMVLLLLTPLFIACWRRGDSVLATRRPWTHLTRCALQVVSMLTFMIAMKQLPLTTITAIMFIAPALVALAAAPILGERIRPPQVVALVTGLIGCLIILRPSGEGQAAAILLAVISAATWALSLTLLRLLTRTESQATIFAWTNGNLLLFGLAFSAFDWRPLDMRVLALVAAMSVAQIFGQWCSMIAFRLASAATVAPMQYTQIIWATIYGSVMFGEWPSLSVWIGAAFIVAGGLWLVYAEGRREFR
ncbi:MAG: hypothetical protein BGP06_01685 [Rhizobiales bacterium 65-9]|nr:DMT family transporter [Hyphomicrobiales bacterium]OJY37665.1 MAG: hypothetical protein BGP06_01685 [Rhizobiales bacterium 65-9]